MSRRKRQAYIPTPAWERPRGALGRRVFGYSPRAYAVAAVVALMVFAIGLVGYAFWSDYRADQQRPGSTAVRVEDSKYSLRYFAERLRLFVQQAGGPANQSATPSIAIPAVIEQIIQESIVRDSASEKEVSVSEDEIKEEIGRRINVKVDDATFDQRFLGELDRSQLKEDEYRLMVESALLTEKIRTKFQDDLPKSAESVHYRQILVVDAAAGEDVKKRVEAGADFAEVAKKESLDTTTRDKGGDLGWVARGVLDKPREDAVFGLKPNAVTVFSETGRTYVFQLVEKSKDRKIEDSQKPVLAFKAFTAWVDEKRANLKIEESVSKNEDNAKWVIDRVYNLA